MKKNIKKLIAITLAVSLMLSGCSLSANKDKEPENTEHSGTSGQIVEENNEVTTSNSTAELSAPSSEIIVAEDLSIPDPEEIASAESTTSSAVEIPEELKEQYNIDENLVMVFFGDSQIANGRSDGTDIPTLVSQKVPYSTAYNLAIGGTTAALEMTTSEVYDEANWTSNCFYGMVLALEGTADRNRVLDSHPDVLNTMNQVNPAEVDYYFIEYGANDFFNKVPLDTYTPGYEDVNELYTYLGALSRGIDKLRRLSPNATIVLISPFYGLYFSGDGTYIGDAYITSNGLGTLQDYSQKMGLLAGDGGFYMLDTMYRSKFDLYLDTYDKYLMDSLHLTLTGRQILARLLAHVPNTMEGYEPLCYRTTDYVYIDQFDPNYYYELNQETFASTFPDEYQRYLNGEFLLAKPHE